MNLKIKKHIKKIVYNNRLFSELLLFSPAYNRYYFESLYDYVKSRGTIVDVIDDRTTMKFKKPASSKKEFENWSQEGMVDCPISRIYISYVNNACVKSGNDGIYVDGKCLNDRIEWDMDGIDLYPPPETVFMNKKEIILRTKITKKAECGIFLLKEFTPNIFHFTMEAICRLKYVDDLGKYDNWPVLLDANGRDDERTQQLLSAVNVKKHPIIWVDHGETIEVKQLLVPPILAWGARSLKWRNEKNLGILVHESVPEIMRGFVLKNHHPRRTFNKVYVERGNNKRLTNEDKVKAFFLKNGFEVFNPDEGDFWDEVDCFATADVIVTVVGGAMTNALYCKKEVRLIEICPFERQTVAYTFLIETMQLKNMRMISPNIEVLGPSINTTTFSLDERQCHRIVEIAERGEPDK